MFSVLALTWALTDPFSLEWNAPPDCPDRTEITARISAAVGNAEGSPVHARATVVRRNDGTFDLQLHLARDGENEGSRTLNGTTCKDVTDAAVLIVAIAVDPEAALAPPPDPEPAEPMPAASVANEEADPSQADPSQADPPDDGSPPQDPTTPTFDRPRPDPTPERPRQRNNSLRVDGVVFGGLRLGVLPSVGAAVSGHVALLGQRWRVELGGTYATPREETSRTNPDVRGRIQLWTIDGRGCPVVGRGAWTVPLCMGIRAGLMHGAGRGELEASSGASPWVAATVAPTLLWRPKTIASGRLVFGVRSEGAVSLTRPGFATTSGQVFEARSFGLDCGAIVGVSLR